MISTGVGEESRAAGHWRLPIPPSRIYGRDGHVAAVVASLLANPSQPVLIPGGPGMGKTTLSRAAACHQLATDFFGDRRAFAELEAATNADQLLRKVALATGLEDYAPAEAHIRRLADGRPLLLVLDNLETPWLSDDRQTTEVLTALASLAGVRLLASYRGARPPLGLAWRTPKEADKLPEPTARQLFLDLAGEDKAGDPALPGILRELDGLALAIELVAWQAASERSLGSLALRWKARPSLVLRSGKADHRLTNLERSIALSLDALGPDTAPARHLFGLMGLLPEGLAVEDVDAILPGDGQEAASDLRAVRLASDDDAGRLRMLAPIRELAAEALRAPKEEERLNRHYLDLAWSFQGEQLPDRLRARAELRNIEAAVARVLEGAVGGETSAVRLAAVASALSADEHVRQGSLASAAEGIARSLSAFNLLAAAAPGNAQWQHDLSVSWSKLGDVRVAQGDLPGALQAFTEGKTIRDRLAAADPGNAQWQRDLGQQRARRRPVGPGRPARPRRPTTASMNIAKLAAADPGNAQWQRDLSVSWIKLGDVRVAQGDLPGALQAFTESKNIADKLAAADPGNAGWQRDLSVSWDKLGDVRRAQGDLPGALQAYTEGKNILDKLAAADPGNAEWQRDLSVSWNKLGDVRVARGDLQGALQAFTESKNIRDKLAAADPGNAEWQRDLSVSWNKLGDVRRAQGDLPGALQAFTESKNIRDKLAAADPGNAEWQRDLIVSHWNSPTCSSGCPTAPPRPPATGRRPSPSPAPSPTPAASPRPTPTSSRPWSSASPPPRPHPARHPDPPAQPSATHPDRRILRAHPFPPASPPSASSGGQAPARPRSARAPGSARPLVHPPDDNPKIANKGLTRHLTGPALPMIIAG